MQQDLSTCSLYLTSHEFFEPTFAPLVYWFAPKVTKSCRATVGCMRIDDGNIHIAPLNGFIETWLFWMSSVEA